MATKPKEDEKNPPGKKKCPKCGKFWGPRQAICDPENEDQKGCGHKFKVRAGNGKARKARGEHSVRASKNGKGNVNVIAAMVEAFGKDAAKEMIGNIIDKGLLVKP